MSRVESDFKNCSQAWKWLRWGDGGENEAQDAYLHAELLYQDIVKARINYEFWAAVDDAAAPVNCDKNQQHSYVFIRKGLFLK
jgi:hypothetical protein